MATVVGRHIFYGGSAWGETIAPDKSALVPGETASFANYISYGQHPVADVGGIRGLFVDVDALANPGAISAADFRLTYGNDDQPVYWPLANPPDSVSVSEGAGQGGSDRIKLLWDASAILNSRWLQVVLLANANTGLPADDVHYWGWALGETGDSASDAMVTIDDVYRVAAEVPSFGVPITSVVDINRDGDVTSSDVQLVTYHFTVESRCLKLITPTLWRFTGRADAGCCVVIGQEAGRVVVPGQEAGRSVVPGQEAGRSVVPGQQAGRCVVPGQEAGRVV